MRVNWADGVQTSVGRRRSTFRPDPWVPAVDHYNFIPYEHPFNREERICGYSGSVIDHRSFPPSTTSFWDPPGFD
jgi:hypothetical protein